MASEIDRRAAQFGITNQQAEIMVEKFKDDMPGKGEINAD
jgi:hypothetical protein